MSRPKVLVVDDDPTVRRFVIQLLSAEFELELAASGEEALGKLSSDSLIEAVVSDIEMPGLDGAELMHRCEWGSRLPRSAFVFMSGNPTGTRALGLTEGGSTVLKKPFDKADLISEVRKALTGRDLRHRMSV